MFSSSTSTCKQCWMHTGRLTGHVMVGTKLPFGGHLAAAAMLQRQAGIPSAWSRHSRGEQAGQLLFCIMTACLMDIWRGRRCERGSSSGGGGRWAGRSLHQEPPSVSPAIASMCLGRGGIARLNQYATAGFIFIPGIFKLLTCSTAVTEPAVRQCLASPF